MMGLFDDNSRDTFRLSGKEFHIGWQTLHLNPQVKREATICNLFANHGLAVTDIIRILDENYENVIHSLIKHQIVLDRRQQPRGASRSDEPRHGHLKTGRPRQSRKLLMEGLESLFGFRKLK